jgi:hypothetical protein
MAVLIEYPRVVAPRNQRRAKLRSSVESLLDAHTRSDVNRIARRHFADRSGHSTGRARSQPESGDARVVS